jgi:hypothetical protein
MKNRFHKFNIYLALAALLLACGCASYRKAKAFSKQEQSTIRLYMEGNRGDVGDTGNVLVTRNRFPYTIDRAPFLKEDDLIGAQMIDGPGHDGGYFIELHFNEHGALMLDMLTTGNKGRHIVVYSQFPHPGYKPPKVKQPKPGNIQEEEQYQETIPQQRPELEKPGEGRTSGWLAAVLIKGRDTGGVFRFSPDASREETARIVRGLQNVIAYSRSIDLFNNK